MAGLTQAVLAGVRWSALSQGLAQLAQYGSFIVLARLLSPEDFGTLASAMVVVGLAALLNELGMGQALIQRRELTPGHLSACFWTNVAVGGLVAILTALTAPAVAAFFGNPAIAAVLPPLALSFLLAAASVLPRAVLERGLRFKALSLIEAAGAIATGGTAVGLALAGHGVWSMVWGTLAGHAVLVAGLWAHGRPPIGGGFSRREFLDLFGFGASVLGSRVLGYWSANVDCMIIGKLLGPAALGLYSLAYKLVTWPMLKISHVALRVAYPALARLQDDDDALRRQYLKLVGTLALVVLPLLTAIALLAPELIRVVFGPRWAEAALPAQILCGAGAAKALACSVGTVFLTKGRPDLELKLNLLGAIKLPLFLLAGVPWGMAGVAWALLASNLTGAPLQQHVANRLIGLSWRAYAGALAAPLWVSAGVAAALAGWRALAGQLADPWLLLGGSAAALAASAAGFAAVHARRSTAPVKVSQPS